MSRKPSGSPAPPLYEASGLFVLRAPVLAANTLENLGGGGKPARPQDGEVSRPEPRRDASKPSTAEPDELAARRVEGRRALLALARSPRVRQALHVASPGLGAAVNGLDGLDGLEDQGKRSARAYSALVRYLTRMSTRPTPHGLFAGVATGTFTAGTVALLDDDPVRLTRTRADSAWLHTVLRQVEDDETVRDHLPVCVNDLLYQVGGCVVLFRQDSRSGRAGDRVEIRLTRPVEAALELAASNPLFGELVTRLGVRFPGTRQETIRALLGRLWDARVLIGDLQPPLTDPRPEQYVLDRLTGLGAGAGTVLSGLRTTRHLADEVDRHPGAADTALLSRLSAHQRAMAPGFTGPTFRLDTALAATVELPGEVAAAAAEAAETLLRLGCLRPRPRHLVEYHQHFLERYGMGSELPLLDVLRPETGLGPPNDYHVPPRHSPLPPGGTVRHDARDRALIELAAHSARHRLREVELDDDWFRDLEVWGPDGSRFQPRTSLDLFAQLAADSPEAIDEGRWRLVPGAFGCSGGMQSLGRLCHLFDDAALTRIQDHARAEEGLRPDVVFAELTYHPQDWLGSNVAIHPSVRRYEIAVNVSSTVPADRRIALGDVVVGANSDHFYLRSARLGQRLVVSQTHALSYRAAPNVCRALLEFSADGFAYGAAFDWGVLGAAPFLPRLTRGRTVVHPARWTINRRTFPNAVASPDDFLGACRRWREIWDVPRYVCLSEFDNRLLLDLEHPLWVDELYREVDRQRRAAWPHPIALYEALPGPADLWLRDRSGRPYHAEITVPLRLRESYRVTQPGLAAPADTVSPPVPAPAVVRRWQPGDEWVHLKLYSAPDQHDALIAGPLRTFLEGLEEAGRTDRWFFIRYSDPLPHLRLRFHTRRADGAAGLMARCAAWGRGLVRQGLAVDLVFASYDREVERYGGPHAIETLEEVFCRNSEVSAELVRQAHADPAGLDIELLCVASTHALYRDWGAPPAGMRHGDGTPGVQDSARERFRGIRPLLCEILAPGEVRPDARAERYRAVLEPVLARQHDAVRAAGDQIRRLAERGLLTGSEENVIDSLAHIQANRLLGVDRDREVRCRDLWALALRAIRGRPQGRDFAGRRGRSVTRTEWAPNVHHTRGQPGTDSLS